MPFGPVAIFWDYENCSPQHGAGFTVVDNIRQIALQYGSVKVFKAYLELSEQSSSKSLSLRSELQSCGVSLTDCPHNGRKDVADKMMIVDMLTYAIDTPAPATVMLISGDRDFVYAVSVLRLRQYHVVVIAPGSAHSSLRSRASEVYDWDATIVNRSAAPPASHGRSSSASVEASAGIPGLDGEHNYRQSRYNPTQPSGGILRAPRPQHHSFSRESNVYSSASVSFTPSPVKLTRQDPGDSSPQNSERRPVFVFPKVSATDTQTVTTEPQRGVTFDSKPGHTTHSRSMSMPSKGLTPAPVDPTLLSPMSHAPATNPAGLAPPERAASRNVIEESAQTAAETRNTNMETDSLPISDPIGDATCSISIQGREAENEAFSPASGPAEPRESESTEVPVVRPTILRSTKATPSLRIATGGQSATLPAAADRPDDALIIESQLEYAFDESPLSPDLPNISLNALQVPPFFTHLVDILATAYRAGLLRLLRSTVAVELTQRNPSVYREAGVEKFKEYTALAESMGLVTLGGIHGTAWIALGPSCFGA